MNPVTLITNFNPATLVPPNARVSLTSLREIQLLGFEGIQQFIARWRALHRRVDEQIRFIEGLANPPSPFGLNAIGLKLEAPYRALGQAQHELKKTLPEVLKSRDSIKSKIDQLSAFRKYAVRSPLLPQLRPSEWFNIGEEVVVCVGGTAYRGVYESIGDLGAEIRIEPGKDGIVFSGTASPSLRLPWEHDLLTNNQEIALFWETKAAPVNNQ
jgi:hypothetical protein